MSRNGRDGRRIEFRAEDGETLQGMVFESGSTA